MDMAEHRTAAVMEALASVYDPCCQEKGLSVVDMGLVGEISEKAAAVAGTAGSTVEIVWDEPWTTDRLSDKARRALRFLPHPKEVGR